MLNKYHEITYLESDGPTWSLFESGVSDLKNNKLSYTLCLYVNYKSNTISALSKLCISHLLGNVPLRILFPH